MNNPKYIKDVARDKAREILTQNEAFKNMSIEDQKKIYIDVVEDQIDKLKKSDGAYKDDLSQAKAGGLLGKLVQKGKGGSGKLDKDRASRLIDDSRHEKGFEEGVDAFEDLVDSVDFPAFVRDLLRSVFDANISVMKSQTDDYIRLMKEATSGLAKFIKQIDDTTTFAYLAENKSDEFNISLEEGADGSEKMSLTNPQGEVIAEEGKTSDIGDNKVKAMIMDAKIKMAQEHRAALREMVLMGLTRLVVDKGVVEAEVNFEFKGKRTGEKKDKAINKTSKSEGTSARASGGFIGSIFGGPSAGHTRSKQTTKFSVSSAKSTSEDELKAKLRGFVKIDFKTDYFKLDNFAQMYAPPSAEDKQAALPAPASA